MNDFAARWYRRVHRTWHRVSIVLVAVVMVAITGTALAQSALVSENGVFQPEGKWSSTPPVAQNVKATPSAAKPQVMLASQTQSVSRRPNIVIILADDMGYSDIGCYGGEIETPHLDQLAAGGLRFTQCYNTARCWPSRGAIMTGYYAQQIRRDSVPGVPSGGRGTRPAWAPLLSEVLRQYGYRCYHSGKWHIDSQPWNTGFDHGYVINDHDRFFTPKNHVEDGKALPQPKPEDNFYLTTEIGRFATKYLKEHAEQYGDKPFFLHLCFTSPHFPLQAPQDVIAHYLERYRVGWNVIQRQRGQRLLQMGLVHNQPPAMELQLGPPYHFPEALQTLGPNEVNRPLPWDQLTKEQQAFQATKMAIHAAMVHIMDQAIGEVISQLKAMNALDHTLIMFASDNGASAEIMVRGDGHDPNAPMGSGQTFLCLGPGWSSASNTPFRRHKTWVHEGGISTPFIVHWPDGIKAQGELRHTPVHFIDVFPTVLDVAGIELPREWNGQERPPLPGLSFAPLFAQDGAIAHDYLWFMHEGNRAIRVGDWKLVAARDEPWELYNLAEDRGETNNLIAQQPDKAKQLEDLWNRLWEQFQADAKRDLPQDRETRASQAKSQRRAGIQ
jgi:arylsulfatase A-like enzyme